MLVQCPSCRTTYRVADDVVKGAVPAFRCSRCKHNFELEGAETAPATPEKPAPSEAAVAPEPQDRELTFRFSPPAGCQNRHAPPARGWVSESTCGKHRVVPRRIDGC